MAEWSIAAVLKTVDLHGSGGSNPSLSAEDARLDILFFYVSIGTKVNRLLISQICCTFVAVSLNNIN